MKVAIAVGDARRFVVGDPDIQLIDVLAGRLMDDLAEAEHHAEKGEIVLDSSAIEALGDRVELSELRRDGEADAPTASFGGLLAQVDGKPVRQPAALPEELVRPWLLPAVYERMKTGRGEFLAELRPAIPCSCASGASTTTTTTTRSRSSTSSSGPRRASSPVRRQRPAADARRQGRLPLWRLRVAARPRGRRARAAAAALDGPAVSV